MFKYLIKYNTHKPHINVNANPKAGVLGSVKPSLSSITPGQFVIDCFALPLRPTQWLPMTVLMIFILFTSCEEKINWQLETKDINTIVVDAQLTNEYKYQHIYLAKPFSDVNEEAIPVSGASVFIVFDNINFPFIESPDNPGHYYSETQDAASVNNEYKLNIKYEGKVYNAETYMMPVSNTNPPGWDFDEATGMYKINWYQGLYNQFEQSMFEATISWSHLVGPAFPDSIAYAKLMYYTFNTIDVSYVIFPQDKEEVLVPRNSIAVIKKYSLTDGYASYLRALIAETEWQGSLFEEARGNLPTNISNGGLGYFSACSVITDTLVVH